MATTMENSMVWLGCVTLIWIVFCLWVSFVVGLWFVGKAVFKNKW